MTGCLSQTANCGTFWYSTKSTSWKPASARALVVPGGLAVDNENRFLYVADTGLDQILVFDADPPYKFIA